MSEQSKKSVLGAIEELRAELDPTIPGDKEMLEGSSYGHAPGVIDILKAQHAVEFGDSGFSAPNLDAIAEYKKTRDPYKDMRDSRAA